MAIPGFTAEKALGQSKGKYRGKNVHNSGGLSVSPQSEDLEGDYIEYLDDDSGEEEIEEIEIED